MSPYEVLGFSLLAVAASMFLALFVSMKSQANRMNRHARERQEFLEKARASQYERCATCGMRKSEHHYNGAAYGVCGNFKRRPFGKRPKN